MIKYNLSGKKTLFFLAIMFSFTAGNAMAQMKFGLRAGGTINPEQFHFGAHLVTDPLFDNFTFRPNLEVGVSKFVVIATNFEFAYAFQFENKPFSLYAGLGPSVIVAADSNNADAGGGFNILFGLEHRNGFMGEMKVGAIDSPDLKFTIGYTFH